MMRLKLEYIFFIGGLLILSLGINMMTTITSFGLSPYDSFFIALYQNFGVSIGFWIFMINFAFTLIVLYLNKKYITIGTIVTMILISVFVDAIGSIDIIMDFIRSLPKYITLVCGNLFVGAGIGVYVSTQLCAAPQEAFVLTVSEKRKWTFRRTEISLAFLFLTISFLLDGPIYFGTIILSFTTGWIIQAFIHIGTKILHVKKPIESM
ncbi:YitT family protein [Bacillus sp. DX1.1]|uniref:YczE/YyaS/YitT family protein n=1 Tax=unclassified Bacillus (in: firmicutes) TaxID=185979 RepID=UPI002570FBB1|nr:MULTISPECIES: YitT family protein [unclassified Bacillus (in: firmicutes)]MDM5157517.1 YitT family protein [Bacillus sp. DX1.1]WJE81735.1 YitT family protein [Bacillus sp. DX3.1]